MANQNLNAMKKLLAVLLALPTTLAIAQPLEVVPDSTSALPDPNRYATSIYAMVGLGPSTFSVHTGYGNMYSLLEAQDVQLLWRDRTLYSLGFGARLQRWHLDFLIARAPSWVAEYPASSPAYLEVDADFLTANLNAGFALIQSRNDVWLMQGGVGLTEYYLRVIEVAPGQPFDMANIEASPAWRVWPSFSHTSATGYVGIAWQRGGRPKRNISVITNGSLGYQFGLGRPRWKSSNIPLLNAPTDRAGAIYLGLDIRIARNFERKQN